MLKAHCDNCDAVVGEHAVTARPVTVQPWGYQCLVTMTIQKEGRSSDQDLCAECLKTAATAFIASLSPAVGREP